MPTSRRQKHVARNLAPLTATPRPPHPAVAHPSSPPKPPKVQIRPGKFGTLRASVGPPKKGR
jgi:hypothetical protein